MRLHNRQLKAAFFNDPDLLQWPRDKRLFYAGLVQIADDSGCLEDNEFSFKLLIFPSPLDSDITTEKLSLWKNELIADKKLISYAGQRKDCLYLCNFHKHQSLKNPSVPTVPLPTWIKWIPTKSNPNAGKYSVDQVRVNAILNGDNSYISLSEALETSYDIPSDSLGSSGNTLNENLGTPDNVLTDNLDSSNNTLSNALEGSYEILTGFFQPKPEPEPEPEPKPKPKPELKDDDDDSAHAREKSERVTFGFDQDPESTENPGNALGTKAIAYAEANFGRPLSQIEVEAISNFCTEFSGLHSRDPDGIIIEALRRCVEQKPRNKLRYLNSILDHWLDCKVIDLADIKKLDADFIAANKTKGDCTDGKNIGTSRINDQSAYDPTEWAGAGFAVST